MELRLISTTYEGKERITKEQTIPFCDDAGREDQLINLYPQVTYQRMDGFGGAIRIAGILLHSIRFRYGISGILSQALPAWWFLPFPDWGIPLW